MADTRRVALVSDPNKWVEIKTRWSYRDKCEIGSARIPTLEMLNRCVIDRNFKEPANLEELPDEDGQAIADAIADARIEELKGRDPNSQRASSKSSSAAEARSQ